MGQAPTIFTDRRPGPGPRAASPTADRRTLISGKPFETGRTFALINPATGNASRHAPIGLVTGAEAPTAAARRAVDDGLWATDLEFRICFAERFDAHQLTEAAAVGSSTPLDPSENLTVKGDPPGATGVAQFVELCQRRCGEGSRSSERPLTALALNIEGPITVSAVTILKGSGTSGV